MRKGHYFSIEGLRKGYLFCQKRYLKGNWYKPRGGGGAPRTKRCWAPPPPGLLLSFVCFCLRLTQGIAQKEHDITVETFASCIYFLCVGLVTEKERGIRKIYLNNITWRFNELMSRLSNAKKFNTGCGWIVYDQKERIETKHSSASEFHCTRAKLHKNYMFPSFLFPLYIRNLCLLWVV